MSSNELYLIKEADALIENIGANFTLRRYVRTATSDLIELYEMIGRFRLGKDRRTRILLGRYAVAQFRNFNL